MSILFQVRKETDSPRVPAAPKGRLLPCLLMACLTLPARPARVLPMPTTTLPLCMQDMSVRGLPLHQWQRSQGLEFRSFGVGIRFASSFLSDERERQEVRLPRPQHEGRHPDKHFNTGSGVYLCCFSVHGRRSVQTRAAVYSTLYEPHCNWRSDWG
ncbi:hypothetical protein O3P69_020526 [Scylla paramamosain]|uniref:Uncharacterized protein n=1 Tax=Scylla paramamosain TaxID=85552 RepID=A0AAW0TLG6_SCYPA